MSNTAYYLFRKDAALTTHLLVPEHASRAEIHESDNGWWINVFWNCGEVAPLTYNEELQAKGEAPC